VPQSLAITSIESLDATVADVVRRRVQLTKLVAERDAEIALISKQRQPAITNKTAEIAGLEAAVLDYCEANRAALFPDKKSRETSLAVFGFEWTPWRVETSSRKHTWKDVVKRLLRMTWGKAYVRKPDPKPDKEALLADREKLTAEQLTAAGISFEREEQFFLRPKLETAEASTPASPS